MRNSSMMTNEMNDGGKTRRLFIFFFFQWVVETHADQYMSDRESQPRNKGGLAVPMEYNERHPLELILLFLIRLDYISDSMNKIQ